MAANDWQVFTGPPYISGGPFNSTLDSQHFNFQCNIKPNGVCDTLESKGVAPLCQPEAWSEYTSQQSQPSYFANQKTGRTIPRPEPWSTRLQTSSGVQPIWSLMARIIVRPTMEVRQVNQSRGSPIRVHLTSAVRASWRCTTGAKI